jgi:hypothetical protein
MEEGKGSPILEEILNKTLFHFNVSEKKGEIFTPLHNQEATPFKLLLGIVFIFLYIFFSLWW